MRLRWGLCLTQRRIAPEQVQGLPCRDSITGTDIGPHSWTRRVCYEAWTRLARSRSSTSLCLQAVRAVTAPTVLNCKMGSDTRLVGANELDTEEMLVASTG